MDETIIATDCLCDDLLHAMHHQENPQNAEVLTTALRAAFFFRGHLESARWMLNETFVPYQEACAGSRSRGAGQHRILVSTGERREPRLDVPVDPGEADERRPCTLMF